VSSGDPGERHLPVAVSRARRRVFWGLSAFITAFVIGGIAVSVVVVLAAADFARSFGHIGERDHLKPIPVAESACPYVVAMHNAANDFQSATPIFGLAPDAHGIMRPWPQARPALSHAADVLDVTIAAGIPHVPPQVQTYLTRVRVDIDGGRRQAALAATPDAFLARVEPLLENGKTAFGFAGDLVGHACSVDLGADSAVQPARP
jgi:hypothetical protein